MSTEIPKSFGMPTMDDDEERRLLVALTEWVARIREPDRPLVAYQGLDVASPREVVRGVAIFMNGGSGPEAELGRRYLETINSALEEVPFELFIASIERSGNPRLRPLRWILEVRDRISFELRRRRERRQERRRRDDDISASSGPSV
jgi:hypothetical protein